MMEEFPNRLRPYTKHKFGWIMIGSDQPTNQPVFSTFDVSTTSEEDALDFGSTLQCSKTARTRYASCSINHGVLALVVDYSTNAPITPLKFLQSLKFLLNSILIGAKRKLSRVSTPASIYLSIHLSIHPFAHSKQVF